MEKPQKKMAKNCDELSKAFSCMHANERKKINDSNRSDE